MKLDLVIYAFIASNNLIVVCDCFTVLVTVLSLVIAILLNSQSQDLGLRNL